MVKDPSPSPAYFPLAGMKGIEVTQAEVDYMRERLVYYPATKTGQLYWRDGPQAGKLAGIMETDGKGRPARLRIRIGDKLLPGNKVYWAVWFGIWPKGKLYWTKKWAKCMPQVDNWSSSSAPTPASASVLLPTAPRPALVVPDSSPEPIPSPSPSPAPSPSSEPVSPAVAAYAVLLQEAPELADILWKAGKPELAEDVISQPRVLWEITIHGLLENNC